MSIALKSARESDAEAVARLAGQLGYPCDERLMAARLHALGDREDGLVVVADCDGEVVGLIHVQAKPTLLADRVAQVVALVVDEDHRNQGIGKRLLAAAEEWARHRGCERVELYSNAKRVAAHRFYFAQGYDQVKESVMLARRL